MSLRCFDAVSFRHEREFSNTESADPMKIKTIAFDTGGTVQDWHSGLVGPMAGVSEAHGIAIDCHAAVNDWHRRALKAYR